MFWVYPDYPKLADLATAADIFFIAFILNLNLSKLPQPFIAQGQHHCDRSTLALLPNPERSTISGVGRQLIKYWVWHNRL